jgi:hypothetical protein
LCRIDFDWCVARFAEWIFLHASVGSPDRPRHRYDVLLPGSRDERRGHDLWSSAVVHDNECVECPYGHNDCCNVSDVVDGNAQWISERQWRFFISHVLLLDIVEPDKLWWSKYAERHAGHGEWNKCYVGLGVNQRTCF